MNRFVLLFFLLLLGAAACKTPESDLDQRTRAVPFPVDVSRAEWGAKAPTLPMEAHEPSRITIHHTATRMDAALSLEEKLQHLQAFSQRRDSLAGGAVKPPWADVPYHFYIAGDGRVAEGRDIRFAGDSNTPYDPSGHVLVVVEGNFEVETLTAAQEKALLGLTKGLVARYNIPADSVKGHRDFAATQCPGEALYNFLPELRSDLRARSAPQQ